MKAIKAVLAIVLLFSAFSVMAKGPGNSAEMLAKPYITNDLISLQPIGTLDVQRYELTVRGPNGILMRQNFSGVNVPFIELYDLEGDLLPDGPYVYELRAIPQLSDDAKKALRAVRESGNTSGIEALRTKGVLPEGVPAQSGYFRIHEGFIVVPGAPEPNLNLAASTAGRPDGANPTEKPAPVTETGGTTDSGTGDRDGSRDQVILDDLIVDGSACIGFDCVNGESFGFDTIRLKENNLRIKFDDTSAAASFPATDWQLTANDSANGGASKFSIDDISGGRTPFTVEANAPSHSLYVDDGGRLGLGTSIPVADIHAVSGNTPTLRLEQNGSSGFAPQTWDVAGNETNFFVRDATNGSTLPFRIRPGAPSSALFIDVDGDVGIGDASPDADFDVENGWMRITDNGTRDILSGEASFLVEQTASASNHVLMRLASEGQVNFLFEDTSDSVIWKMTMNGGGGSNSAFQISRDGSGVNELNLSHDGDLTVTGSVTASCGTLSCASDRNLKENFEHIDPSSILTKVLAMPVTTWNYKRDGEELRHIGPVAQDFYAAFGVGADEKSISVTDSAGVAFGAIQGLYEVIENKDNEIQTLKGQLAAQEARLKALEKALLD